MIELCDRTYLHTKIQSGFFVFTISLKIARSCFLGQTRPCFVLKNQVFYTFFSKTHVFLTFSTKSRFFSRLSQK